MQPPSGDCGSWSSAQIVLAAAAAVLAGFPQFELQVLRCREIYFHTRSLSDGVGPVSAEVKVRPRRALLDRWRVSLGMRAGAPGLRILEAVLPNWDVWLDGDGPPLTYRVTHVLTGHGCFGEYLHRIGKEATAHSHHCDASVDSAQYTLEYCPAPRPHRGNRMRPLAAGDLRSTVGEREREEGRDLLL